MLNRVKGLDEALRLKMAEQAYEARARQVASIQADLTNRMGAVRNDAGFDENILQSVAANIGQNIKRDPVMVAKDLRDSYGKPGLSDNSPSYREDLIRQAAVQAGAGPMTALQSRLSGISGGDRAVQAGVYGSGVAMGMTAAGQALDALRDYMQEGLQQMEERETPLRS